MRNRNILMLPIVNFSMYCTVGHSSPRKHQYNVFRDSYYNYGRSLRALEVRVLFQCQHQQLLYCAGCSCDRNPVSEESPCRGLWTFEEYPSNSILIRIGETNICKLLCYRATRDCSRWLQSHFLDCLKNSTSEEAYGGPSRFAPEWAKLLTVLNDVWDGTRKRTLRPWCPPSAERPGTFKEGSQHF